MYIYSLIFPEDNVFDNISEQNIIIDILYEDQSNVNINSEEDAIWDFTVTIIK
jgi:hypothetical protein